jgi:hypothetical protein
MTPARCLGVLCCAWVAWELACTDVALMDNFVKISTTHVKIAMRTAWIQWGRAGAPPLYPGAPFADAPSALELLQQRTQSET